MFAGVINDWIITMFKMYHLTWERWKTKIRFIKNGGVQLYRVYIILFSNEFSWMIIYLFKIFSDKIIDRWLFGFIAL